MDIICLACLRVIDNNNCSDGVDQRSSGNLPKVPVAAWVPIAICSKQQTKQIENYYGNN